jgi:putative addiction module antidote
MVFDMVTLKVTRVGNSAGVILPREVLARLRVEKGGTVCLTETPNGFEISHYDPAFAEDRSTLGIKSKDIVGFVAGPVDEEDVEVAAAADGDTYSKATQVLKVGTIRLSGEANRRSASGLHGVVLV